MTPAPAKAAAPAAPPADAQAWMATAIAGLLAALALLGGAWLRAAEPANPMLILFCALLAIAGVAACAHCALRHQGARLLRLSATWPGAGRLSAELVELLYEQSPLALVLCREDGRLIRANQAFLKLTGLAANELSGRTYQMLVPADAAALEQEALEGLRSRASFAPQETDLLNRDGMRVPVRVWGARGAEADGGVLVWRVIEDMTVRRQMVEALKHSESEGRMLSAVASHTRNMVMICDRNGRIEWVNQAFEDVSGYLRREVLGLHPGSLLQGPGTDPAAVAHMSAGIAARESFTGEVLNYAKDGRAYWVALECAPVFDHMGELERYVAIERDITETRAMHEALAQSEQRFRDLSELSSDFFWEQDTDFRFIQLTEIDGSGLPAQARLGTRPWENPISLLEPALWADHRRVLEAHQPFSDLENPVLSPEGRILWRSISGKPLFAADGGFIGYRGVGHDITGRKETEEYIQESKRMYRRVVEGVRDIIFQADAQGNFVFLNRAFSDATGFDVEEAIGLPIHDYVHPQDREAAERMIGGGAAKGDEYVESAARLRCKNGDYRWFEARVQSYTDADGDFISVGTLHDVSRERAAREERRLAETALREAQERYQRALDAANDGMWERDLRRESVFYSARFKELLGFTDAEFPNDTRYLRARVHPQDWAVFKRGLEEMLTLRQRGAVECRIRCKDESYRWFRLRGTVSCDAQGMPILTSGTLTDIHPAKLAEEELRRHRDNLAGLVEQRTASAEAARVEAVAAREAAETASRSKSEFLANMSHELRTPMHAILSFASFGVDKAGEAERNRLLHYFSNIQKSGNRLLILLNDLLDLSKLEAGKMEMQLKPANPADLLREAMVEAEALAKRHEIRLELETPDQALTAQLDCARLLQVLSNLLSNAIKFSPVGGRVLLSLTPGQLNTTDGVAVAALQVRVRDEGVGIPEAELEAVFDKFVQSSKTKTGAGGTGLGLAICREIVQSHGGTIEARNNPPPLHGACFILRLPLDRRPVAAA
ncbi:MAG TPA: PAS domain S-box protein [Burkholderiales bacterium]|jgi:PAS domain S-box-containing protein|nr:PAS domain S-box protein [Burkholderiales bacterium]